MVGCRHGFVRRGRKEKQASWRTRRLARPHGSSRRADCRVAAGRSGDTAPAPLHASWTSIAGPLGALLFATLLLARHRTPAAARAAGTVFRRVVFVLQSAHTPHAGDHIGWLVLGAGIIALC